MRIFPLFLLLLVPLRAQTLDSVLAQMDTAASSFRSLTARIRSVKHTAIVNDDTVDEGTLWVRRVRPKVSHLLIEFTIPDTYFVMVSEKKAEIYRPKIATVEEYDTTRFRNLKDQIWLLSFGAAGKDLTAHYEVSLKGPDTIDGKAALKLELIPKSKELLQNIPRVEMWVSTSHWQPVQQKFYDITPGDYRVSTYTDLKLNASFPDSKLRLHLPAGTKRVQPQK